jgi:hypothetical protein
MYPAPGAVLVAYNVTAPIKVIFAQQDPRCITPQLWEADVLAPVHNLNKLKIKL